MAATAIASPAAAANNIDSIDRMFGTHHSLSASLEDFEGSDRPSPRMQENPAAHSVFRSDSSEPPSIGDSSDGPWSPPGWRSAASAAAANNAAAAPGSSGWYRHQPYLGGSHLHRGSPLSNHLIASSRSRDPSLPHYRPGDFLKRDGEIDEDLTLPANIPLPKGSMSPYKEMSPSPAEKHAGAVRVGRNIAAPAAAMPLGQNEKNNGSNNNNINHNHLQQQATDQSSNADGNFIHFAIRAEVRQHAELLEQTFPRLRDVLSRATKTRLRMILSLIMAALCMFLGRLLVAPPAEPPAPDLVKVAGLARSFEPLIYYSESGVEHVADLQETSVAVWDLGESVRIANLTSAPIIVGELDHLSESLKGLSLELTLFFAAVDGDIDNILLTMDWARRELRAFQDLSGGRSSMVWSAFSNVHSLLVRILSPFLVDTALYPPLANSSSSAADGAATATATGPGAINAKRARRGPRGPLAGKRVASILAAVIGRTSAQRARATLQRILGELLGALEESINGELTRASTLFTLFASIDAHFVNLQRTTVREFDTQERLEGEVLAGLWQRVLGGNARSLRKFERNKALLQSVRNRTVDNKNLLVAHAGKLIALKQSLETLRNRLVGPMLLGSVPTASSGESDNQDDVGHDAAGAATDGSSEGDYYQNGQYAGPGGGSSSPGGSGGGGGSAAGGGGGAMTEGIRIDEQIRGLEAVHEHLRAVRDAQKSRVMQSLYGSGRLRPKKASLKGILGGGGGGGGGGAGGAGTG